MSVGQLFKVISVRSSLQFSNLILDKGCKVFSRQVSYRLIPWQTQFYHIAQSLACVLLIRIRLLLLMLLVSLLMLCVFCICIFGVVSVAIADNDADRCCQIYVVNVGRCSLCWQVYLLSVLQLFLIGVVALVVVVFVVRYSCCLYCSYF